MRDAGLTRVRPVLRSFALLVSALCLAAAAGQATGAGRAPHGHEGLSPLRGHEGAAATPDLGDVLFGHAPSDERASAAPAVARFNADGSSFVLDVSSRDRALMKFDDSGEVWALIPTPGPRGDTIYKNDLGEPMLRRTQLGGLTVFTHDRPDGAAAALEGAAPVIRNVLLSGPGALLQIMAQASTRASRAAGKLINFEALDLTPGAEPVFADAANLTAQAFVRADHNKVSPAVLGRYSKVAFVNGRPPGVRVLGQEVRITVTPDMGFAGRPSSQRISQVLFRR